MLLRQRGGGWQFITFVDPKGIRNLESPNDPKIAFYQTIRDSIETRLKAQDSTVTLNSFIVSNTLYAEVANWLERDENWQASQSTTDSFEARHVLFQKDDLDVYC